MKLLASLILAALSVVALLTAADEPNYMFWPGTLDSQSQMTCVIDERRITITIIATNNSQPFWTTRDAGRPPLVILGYNIPTITLASNIGAENEIRFEVRPKNRNIRTGPGVIERHLDRVPLFVEDLEVGHATFISDEEKDPRKVTLILNRRHFTALGNEFLILTGNPLAVSVNEK